MAIIFPALAVALKVKEGGGGRVDLSEISTSKAKKVFVIVVSNYGKINLAR